MTGIAIMRGQTSPLVTIAHACARTPGPAGQQRHNHDVMQPMLHMFDMISDKELRARIGGRIETLTSEAFQIIRWSLIVGFARYLSDSFQALIFTLLYWGLASLLFAYLVSRFLLRPEVRIVPNPKLRWQRVLQSLVNMMICGLIFALALWAIGQLTAAISQYRASI